MLRRLILDDRGGSAREKGDGCPFLVDPLRGIGAQHAGRAPGLRRIIVPINRDDEDDVIADEDDHRDKSRDRST